MMARKFMIAATAFLLVACGGGEKYPVPAGEAVSMIAALNNSPAVAPLPAALMDVQVGFEPLPAGNSVQWSFTQDGQDLGKILASVSPDGETASKVRVDYVEPVGPAANPAMVIYRYQVETSVRQLVVEAVDATLDRRPVDLALRKRIDANVATAMVGTMFQDIGKDLQEASAAQDKLDRDRANEPNYIIEPANPRAASAPTSDLRRFNN